MTAEQSSESLNYENYYIVVCPETGDPEVLQFSSLDGAVEALRDLDGQDVHVSVFRGTMLPISVGPYRHLLPPGGDPIPLFALPDVSELVPAHDGFMGERTPDVEIPRAPGVRTEDVEAAEEDAEQDMADDEEEGDPPGLPDDEDDVPFIDG